MIHTDNNIIIIPDIHGRTFWKDAVRGRDEEQFVFLGDYADPYPDEGIGREDAFNNFLEIVRFKEENPGRVTLLLGNHDLHYIYFQLAARRRDSDRILQYRHIFQDKGDLFDIAEEAVAGGRRVIFSHAGILRQWLVCCGLDGKELSASTFNDIWNDKNKRESVFIEQLGMIPYERGGYDEAGSMVWADVREWLEKVNWTDDNTVQIFGHSRMKGPLNFGDRYFSLDCSRHFILDPATGLLLDSKDNTTIPKYNR